MSIKLLNDQGRSPLEQLQARNRERLYGNEESARAARQATDKFERSKADKEADKAAEGTKGNPETASLEADGLNISFQFDLFYELSSKVEAKMGSDGASRFVELSGRVSETFQGNFSLSIDPVGSFMNGTGKSLEISPETTGEFFDAVEGLADLSPEALENFLAESDDFFAELEKKYGEANGAFDGIRNQMQEQAKAFFADVEQARSDAIGGKTETPEILGPAEVPSQSGVDLTSLLPGSASDEESSLIEMFFNPDLKLSQSDYQSFLEEFSSYAEKFRQQMFEKLFNSRNPYEKAGKDDNEDKKAPKLIDTAV